ncbi:MAG: hypothetical protein GY748_02855 [Planctomycetaceae bacterium]|nr:hypothetical protein [Planctomycetaceae bacterium]
MINYKINGNTIAFKCPHCNANLKTKLKDAGKTDNCPTSSCNGKFISPGIEELRIAEERQREQNKIAEERKRRQKKLAEERKREQKKLAEERKSEQNKIAYERRSETKLKTTRTAKKLEGWADKKLEEFLYQAKVLLFPVGFLTIVFCSIGFAIGLLAMTNEEGQKWGGYVIASSVIVLVQCLLVTLVLSGIMLIESHSRKIREEINSWKAANTDVPDSNDSQ